MNLSMQCLILSCVSIYASILSELKYALLNLIAHVRMHE